MPNSVKIEWDNPNTRNSKIFIYKKNEPFGVNNLPDVYAVLDGESSNFIDHYVSESKTYYYMVAVGIGLNREYSELKTVTIQHSETFPHDLQYTINGDDLEISWLYSRPSPENFNLYISNNSIDVMAFDGDVVRGIAQNSYTIENYNNRLPTFIVASIKKDGIEYFSEEILIPCEYPYNIGFSLLEDGLQVEWSSDLNESIDGFNLYFSDLPLDIDDMPTPLVSNIQDNEYLIEDVTNINLRKYVRIGMVVNGNELISEQSDFYAMAYGLDTEFVLDGDVGLHITWDIDHDQADYYNCYISESDTIDLDEPTITGLTVTSCVDGTATQTGKKLIKIGTVIDGIEYLSEEFVYWYEKPFDLNVTTDNNRLNFTWDFDFPEIVDSCNVYISDRKINKFGLPTPVKTDDEFFSEFTHPTFRKYDKRYFCVGVVIDGEQYLSEEFTYTHTSIFDFGVGVSDSDLYAMWACDLLDKSSFTIYHNITPFDANDLPEPLATGIDAFDYQFDGLDIYQTHYFRVSCVAGEVTHISDLFTYKFMKPYQISYDTSGDELEINWRFEHDYASGFNYYSSVTPFTSSTLPIAKETGINDKEYTDSDASIYGKKYTMIGVVRGGREFLSDLSVYRYNKAYDLLVREDEDALLIEWLHDYDDLALFNIYRSSTSMDVENMPTPIATGIQLNSYLDTASLITENYYIRIGLVFGGQETISNEYFYDASALFPEPRNVVADYSHTNDSFTISYSLPVNVIENISYYRSEEPLDIENLPEPILTGVQGGSIVDNTAVAGRKYHILLSNVVDDESYFSEPITEYSLQNPPDVWSPFKDNLNDETGFSWTAVNGASIVDGALKLVRANLQSVTAPHSAKFHFNGSEDITIRLCFKASRFASGVQGLVGTRTGEYGVARNWRLALTENGGIAFNAWRSDQTAILVEVITNDVYQGDVVNEISIERHNMAWRMYLNGDKIGTLATQSTSTYTPRTDGTPTIGSEVLGGWNDRNFNGSISNYQIIRGVALGKGTDVTPLIKDVNYPRNITPEWDAERDELLITWGFN